MVANFGDLIAIYMLPIVIGVVFLIAAGITLTVISRLGNERRDDPTSRSLAERRRRR